MRHFFDRVNATRIKDDESAILGANIHKIESMGDCIVGIFQVSSMRIKTKGTAILFFPVVVAVEYACVVSKVRTNPVVVSNIRDNLIRQGVVTMCLVETIFRIFGDLDRIWYRQRIFLGSWLHWFVR